MEQVTDVVIGYLRWIRELKSSPDKWVSTCAVFIEMANDYLEFVSAYRVGDSVMIEFGYQKQCPSWMIMGQNKYVEITLRQQEVLYRDNKYSRLQECRMNRVVRRCHGNKNKRCVAQDEFLEHGNRFFSEFPMPRSLVGFAGQSRYVGPGLRCKRFCDTWYTTTFKGDVGDDYDRTVAPSMTPEKKMVYEIFKLLDTHKQSDRNQPKIGYVMSIEKKLSTNLRRKVLERAMKEPPKTSVDDLLVSLAATYEESIDTEPAVTTEEELGADDSSGEEAESMEPDAELSSTMKEKIGKKKIH